MITKMDKIFFAGLLVVIAISAIFWKDVSKVLGGDNQSVQIASQQETKAKGKKEEKDNSPITPGVTVVNTSELPGELTEISGLAFIDKDRFLCIQDEQGVLYVYNKSNKKIEKQIPFGSVGDYEGLALAGSTAYVANSSGVIFEIQNYDKTKPAVKQYTTHLNSKNDVEGIAWDEAGNRLLVTVKESGYQDKQIIYSFDLASKTLTQEPVLELDLKNEIFSVTETGKKKKSKGIKPSSIDFNPATGEIYVLEGTNPKLLIMDKTGNPKKLFMLDKKTFPQPEGLAFDEQGKLFISNEGGKGKGTILEVELK